MFQIGLEPGGGGLLMDVRGADGELLHRQPRRLPHRHQHRQHHHLRRGARGPVPDRVRHHPGRGNLRDVEGASLISIMLTACSSPNRIPSNQNSKIRTVKAMVAEIEKRSMFTSTMEEGILKAGDGNFAYIAESSIFDKLDQKERCTFYQVGDVLVPIFYGFGIQKGR